MKAISLCSGSGGMDIGFSAAGFDIKAEVERNDFCRRILEKHKSGWWPNTAFFADARDFGRASIPDTDVDVIFGGPPCQPHSNAGKMLGAADNRNLWPEFRRVIGEFRPRAVLVENVPGILTTYAPVIVGDLAALGYDAQWGIISAADAGAPHLRKRWWCVAYANRDRRQEPPTEQNDPRNEKRDTPAYQQSRRTNTDAIVSGDEAVGNAASNDKPHQSEGNGEIQILAESGTTGRSGPRENSEGIVGVSIGARFSRSVQERQPGNGGETAQWSQSEIRSSQRSGWRNAQRRLGRATHGLPAWLDEPRFPAGQGDFQYQWESPRSVSDEQPHRTSRIQALGNAVVPQIVYHLACGIRDELSKEDISCQTNSFI